MRCWHVLDHFCVEVIGEAINWAEKIAIYVNRGERLVLKKKKNIIKA